MSFIARLMNIWYELIIFHPAVYFFVKGRGFPLNIDRMLVPLPRSLVFLQNRIRHLHKQENPIEFLLSFELDYTHTLLRSLFFQSRKNNDL